MSTAGDISGLFEVYPKFFKNFINVSKMFSKRFKSNCSLRHNSFNFFFQDSRTEGETARSFIFAKPQLWDRGVKRNSYSQSIKFYSTHPLLEVEVLRKLGTISNFEPESWVQMSAHTAQTRQKRGSNERDPRKYTFFWTPKKSLECERGNDGAATQWTVFWRITKGFAIHV